MAADDPRDVALQAERAQSAEIFTTAEPLPSFGAPPDQVGLRPEPRAATAAEAVRAAAAAAREGRRAAVVLAKGELVGALDAIREAAATRAPIVVHVVTAPGGAGHDELAPALEVGAGVLVAWSAQDTIDLALAARRAAEDSETPFLIFADGGGPVMSLPGAGLVAQFLGQARRPADAAQGDVARKRAERGFASRVPFALGSALRALGELTGRHLAPVERYETAHADEVVVAMGQAYAAAHAAAEAMRREGRRVGVVGVRALRPFFGAEAVKAIARARAVAVIEPLDVALAPSGPLAACLKAAFADAITWAPGFPGVGGIPPIVSAVFATLGDGVGEREVRDVVAELAAGDRARRLLVFGSDA
jgi:pyruvate-ferredoxin/flavodoxin oxidoreductase